mmetsp:Transcript_68095/g.134359  ORF Transcript_68095/g.134359 Transcript_68095/m.134359 type:complete len:227 (-) Transcript_68095:43-723(-)
MQCEHCGAADGLDPDAVRACLFCQENDGSAYVPLHYRTIPPPAEMQGPSGVGTPEADGTAAAAPLLAGGKQPAPYLASLESHRGCAACWMRWEAQRAELVAEPGGWGELTLRCPVCDQHIDIRRAYDAVLCRGCQQAIVSDNRGFRLVWLRLRAQVWQSRRVLGLVAICFICGFQALLTMALLEVGEQSLQALLGGLLVHERLHGGTSGFSITLRNGSNSTFDGFL